MISTEFKRKLALRSCNRGEKSLSKLLENHTLHSGTYLYSPYMAVPPTGNILFRLINY